MNNLPKCIRPILLVSVAIFIVSGYAYPSPDLITKQEAKAVYLPYRMLATVLGNGSNDPVCILLNLKSGKQEAYKLDDKIFGYEIMLITRTCVTLKKYGKFYFIDFPYDGENIATREYANIVKIRRNALKKQLPKINSLFAQTQLIPYIESGKIVGIQIPRLKNKFWQNMLNIAGLKEGDIATSINGEKINSLQKALKLCELFNTQENVDIEVKRGAALKNLIYVFD